MVTFLRYCVAIVLFTITYTTFMFVGETVMTTVSFVVTGCVVSYGIFKIVHIIIPDK